MPRASGPTSPAIAGAAHDAQRRPRWSRATHAPNPPAKRCATSEQPGPSRAPAGRRCPGGQGLPPAGGDGACPCATPSGPHRPPRRGSGEDAGPGLTDLGGEAGADRPVVHAAATAHARSRSRRSNIPWPVRGRHGGPLHAVPHRRRRGPLPLIAPDGIRRGGRVGTPRAHVRNREADRHLGRPPVPDRRSPVAWRPETC